MIGVLVAAGISAAWLISLLWSMTLSMEGLVAWQILAILLIRMQLQTGLFIVAHDAMHRVLAPGRPWLNDQLGALALLLYAGLPYGSCRTLHHRHHRFNATPADPDFPSERHPGLLSWYGQFMAEYLSTAQMVRLLIGWGILLVAFLPSNPHAAWTVLMVCTTPLLLSSWQLFLIGTYLPHRHQRMSAEDPAPHSLDWPVWLSFLACYHFGYHREHHDQPQLPWFSLPAQRRQQRQPRFIQNLGSVASSTHHRDDRPLHRRLECL